MAQKKERLSWGMAIVEMLVLLLVVTLNTSVEAANVSEKNNEAVVTCYDTGEDVLLYSYGAYEGIYISEQYRKDLEKIKQEGRLIQATTTIRHFRLNGKMLISHEIIASKNKEKGKSLDSAEYLSYMSDSHDMTLQFSYNLMEEEKFSVKENYSLIWAGKKAYLVVFQKSHTNTKGQKNAKVLSTI